MKRLRTLLLLVGILFFFSIPPAAVQAAPPGSTAYIKDKILLRVEPKPTARVVATLAANVRVRVNHCTEGWCSITAQGLTGFVMEKFLVRAMSRPPADR